MYFDIKNKLRFIKLNLDLKNQVCFNKSNLDLMIQTSIETNEFRLKT